MDNAPGYELVVGRQLSDQVLRSVSVYSFSSGSAEQLMMVGYSKFITCDLNDDGCSELMVILPGESETGTGSAENACLYFALRFGAEPFRLRRKRRECCRH